jgi:hypothetical protein
MSDESQYGEAWKKELAKLTKAEIINLAATIGKQLIRSEVLLRDCVEPLKFCAECSTEDKADEELLESVKAFLEGRGIRS